MPATQVSHTTVRSVSVQDSDADEPPEKYVRYLARHEYKWVTIISVHGVVETFWEGDAFWLIFNKKGQFEEKYQ